MNYAFFKRVQKQSWERPSSVIELMEFKEALLKKYPVEWRIQTKGINVKNPDGSVVNLGPMQGFHIRSEPGSFFHCYSSYGGIVVTLSGCEDVFEMIDPIAEMLKSRVFRI